MVLLGHLQQQPLCVTLAMHDPAQDLVPRLGLCWLSPHVHMRLVMRLSSRVATTAPQPKGDIPQNRALHEQARPTRHTALNVYRGSAAGLSLMITNPPEDLKKKEARSSSSSSNQDGFHDLSNLVD